MQQKSFCYCVADTYNERKMIDEYHTKYKRNIIIKFKDSFLRKCRYCQMEDMYLMAHIYVLMLCQ